MRITATQAGEYFADPKQRPIDFDHENMPEDGFFYYANGDVCGAFHAAPWADSYFGHFGVKSHGNNVEPAREILEEFSEDVAAASIIGWTPIELRAAIAFTSRLGFTKTGEMVIKDRTIVTQNWRPS